MNGLAKQNVGFRFGKHRLSVLRLFGEVKLDGRKYTLVEVETAIGQRYYALRFYNCQRKFIKQLLFEPSVATDLANLILMAAHLQPVVTLPLLEPDGTEKVESRKSKVESRAQGAA